MYTYLITIFLIINKKFYTRGSPLTILSKSIIKFSIEIRYTTIELIYTHRNILTVKWNLFYFDFAIVRH